MADIELTRICIFRRDKWICQKCGMSVFSGTPQLAHLIPQRKRYIKKYGTEIIHHQFNLKSVCSLACNNALSIYGKDLLIKNLVEKIQEDIDKNK